MVIYTETRTKMLRLLFIFFFFLWINSSAYAEEDTTFPQGVTIDLREPTFTEGVLSTEQGGVIQGPQVRIQARVLAYTRKIIEGVAVCTLNAREDLIMEFGEYVFVAEELEYDFVTQTGILYHARTSVEPWYFGGETVLLHPDGSFTLLNGFITTSENKELDWELKAEEAYLKEQRFLSAKNIQMKIYNVPVLWLPCIKTDLESIFDAPIRYNFRWGSHQGARASMTYELFAWNRFKTFARLDYRVKRGLGGGLETYYRSEDHKEIFNTINYVANDNSLWDPDEKIRYRFQGLYHNLIWDDRVSVDLTWDKLSDRDMATDYNDRGLELDTAGRTELLVRKQEVNDIQRFITRVKLNSFESVLQQLPTYEVSWRPVSMGNTGIISNSLFRASFLDFSYGNDIVHIHNYESTRVEYKQEFYRPFSLNVFTLTPKAGCLGIYYGDSPQEKERFLALAYAGALVKSSLSKFYGKCRHVIEPYANFDYFTSPTVSPHHHYIFDIQDGWFQSNTLRLGIINELFVQHASGCLTRPFLIDLYTYGFFNTPTIGKTFPIAYMTISTLSSPTLRHTFDTAWDIQHGELDHFNIRADWTVSESLAIRGEYRHRSPFAWRKADHTNFILDSFRSESELLHSQLSDRRDTLLSALFYQFDPNWAFQFAMRHGWNRKHEPSYTEFETDLIGTLRSAWNIKISYQHREDDDRIAFYFSIGIRKPNLDKCDSLLPCLEL